MTHQHLALARIIAQEMKELGYTGKRPVPFIEYWDDQTIEALATILQRMDIEPREAHTEDDTTSTLYP